jgi:hypothetical protein
MLLPKLINNGGGRLMGEHCILGHSALTVTAEAARGRVGPGPGAGAGDGGGAVRGVAHLAAVGQ